MEFARIHIYKEDARAGSTPPHSERDIDKPVDKRRCTSKNKKKKERQTSRSHPRVDRYTAMDGWCTTKFLTPVSKSLVSMPAAGTAPFLVVFPRPSGSGTVMLFPGQGAQKVGMLAPYCDTPGVKAMFKQASTVFGVDLLEIVETGPVETLNDTRYSQVCVLLTSLAAVKKLECDDPAALANCAACAGFSLGEYTALVFAGVMELATAVELLKVRGEAMGAACDEHPTGMMTVVGLEDATLDELMAKCEGVSVANQLFPKGRVVSGPKVGLAALEQAVAAAGIAGAKTIVQPVSGAFHSKYMASAATKLEAQLIKSSFQLPTRTVYSNVTAKPHENDVASIKQMLKQQLTAGVLWEDTIRDMNTRLGTVQSRRLNLFARQVTIVIQVFMCVNSRPCRRHRHAHAGHQLLRARAGPPAHVHDAPCPPARALTNLRFSSFQKFVSPSNGRSGLELPLGALSLLSVPAIGGARYDLRAWVAGIEPTFAPKMKNV